jgi:hypothetical protein
MCARPLKEGLDYFPLDTYFDEKIQALESVFKNDGLVWIIKFWQSAYRTNNGQVSFSGYQGVIHAENSRVTSEKQNEIIKLCVEIGLLIKIDEFHYTSNGIKKRLGHIVKERERWRFEHNLPVIQADNPRDNPQETGESKVKESKVNKRKDSKPPSAFLSIEDFLKSLKTNPAYTGIDIDRELAKMDAWLITNPGRKKTQRFIVNWLNKIDKPISVSAPLVRRP